MASISNTFEGLGDGVTPTNANTGGASGTATSTVSIGSASTIVGSAAAAIFGARGCRMAWAGNTGDGATRLMWPIAEAGRVVLAAYVRIAATPTQAEDIMGIRHSSGNMAILVVGSNGKLLVNNAAGTGISASAAPDVLAPGTYLIQMSATKGTSTSNGTIGFGIWPQNSATPIHTWESSAVNAGTANVSHVFLGRSTGRAEARTVDYDEMRAETLASGWLSHLALPAPTIDIDTLAPNVIDLRGSSAGDGSSLTYPTPVETTTTGAAIISITPGVWLIADEVTSTWTVTVAQADEQTDSDTVTIPGRLPVHLNAPLIPVGPFPSTTWT